MASRRYLAETIMNADYADYIVLLTNSPTRTESMLYNVEKTASGIDLHVNANKKEYMSFNQEGAISTLNGGPLKLEDKFTYLGNNI